MLPSHHQNRKPSVNVEHLHPEIIKITQVMMTIIIMTASYIGDDVQIVYIHIYIHTFSATNKQGDSRSRIGG